MNLWFRFSFEFFVKMFKYWRFKCHLLREHYMNKWKIMKWSNRGFFRIRILGDFHRRRVTKYGNKSACRNTRLSFMVGWKISAESKSKWIKPMITNYLALRGNCVFFMDYTAFSSDGYQKKLLPHFDAIAAVLRREINKIENFNNTLLFGLSFGSRLVIDAGYDLGGKGEIDQIYACDRCKQRQRNDWLQMSPELEVNRLMHCRPLFNSWNLSTD